MDLSRADWRKSTFSSSNGGQCVEVAHNLPGIVAVRDGKDPHGPALVFTAKDWSAFTASLKVLTRRRLPNPSLPDRRPVSPH